MKKRTEGKRLAILAAAAEVFREMGYERASMSDIRARLGGSKATLYSYFPSKEKLFFEVMQRAAGQELQRSGRVLDPEADDLRQELVHFGQEFLKGLYAPEAVAIRHLTIAESRHSEIGRMAFEQTGARLEKHVGEFLKKSMKRGRLRATDPKIASMHLLSLLESEFLQRFLFGMLPLVTQDAIAGAVGRAVEAFLTGYARPSTRRR